MKKLKKVCVQIEEKAIGLVAKYATQFNTDRWETLLGHYYKWKKDYDEALKHYTNANYQEGIDKIKKKQEEERRKKEEEERQRQEEERRRKEHDEVSMISCSLRFNNSII